MIACSIGGNRQIKQRRGLVQVVLNELERKSESARGPG